MIQPMDRFRDIRPEVATALDAGRPVVALESALIAHGLPYPSNLETALRIEQRLRDSGVVPATIGVTEGALRIGLRADEIERFAQCENVAKVSRRDLAAETASGGDGATTVAATMIAAALAGIRVLATGGIGGVHRGGENSLDISADLTELSRRPVAVVSAGAKVILDLPRTLEVLETQGVPVVGYGTDTFPAFYCRDSGLALAHRVDTPQEAARLIQAHWALGLEGGVLFANPPPDAAALDPADIDRWLVESTARAGAAGVMGKELTPFLLAALVEASGGATLAANIALIEHNVLVAGEIATAYAECKPK